MERKTITKDELDDELESRVDPLRELPAGFPSAHSRFPAIPSHAFIDETATLAPTDLLAADGRDVAGTQEEIRAKLRTLSPQIR